MNVQDEGMTDCGRCFRDNNYDPARSADECDMAKRDVGGCRAVCSQLHGEEGFGKASERMLERQEMMAMNRPASFSYRPNWIKRGHFYVIIAIIDGARI